MKRDSDLERPQGKRIPKKPELPKLLIVVRERTCAAMQESLQLLLNNAEDFLFEKAEASYSNAEQQAYFAAIKELASKKQQFEQTFVSIYLREFLDIPELHPSSGGSRATLTRSVEEESFDALDGLSLIDDEELDETVVVSNIVNKARNTYHQSLFALEKRFCDIIGKDIIDEENNPLDPQQVCFVLSNALDVFDVTPSVKLSMYQLVDKYVMTQIGEVLELANRLLVDAGALKQVKYKGVSKESAQDKATELGAYRATESTPDTKNSVNTVEERKSHVSEIREGADSQEDVFKRLQSLLSHVGTSAKQQGREPQRQGYAVQNSSASHIETDEIVSLLKDLEQKNFNELDELPDDPRNIDQSDVNALKINIREHLGRTLQKKQQGLGESELKVFSQDEENIIDLVSKLFDFILEDDNLPIPMQALLGKLQIPILKVAIQDKQFFRESEHVARMLLNELARMGIGWNDADDDHDVVYNKIREVVNTIRHEFKGDISLFDIVYQDFSKFVQVEQQRTRLIEKRTKDAEIGQEKLLKARDIVNQLLRKKLVGFALPKAVALMIKNGWSNVLFLYYVKYGDESDQWQHCLRIVDHILWLLQPESVKTSSHLWDSRVDLVRTTTQAELEKISYDVTEYKQYLTAFEDIVVTLKSKACLPENMPTLKLYSSNTVFKSHQSEIEKEIVQLQDAAGHDASTSVPLSSHESVKTRTTDDATRHRESERMKPFFDVVSKFGVSDWFEFKSSNDQAQRCKLAAIDGDNFLFVNRRGVKVFQKHRKILAYELCLKRVRQLDHEPLFDRALTQILNRLSSKN